MRRFLLATSLLAGLVAFGPKPADARISADINLHIGRRSPTVYFQREPRGYLIPSSDVYYFDDYGDYDMFRYGGFYYVNDGGYWYRSRSWGGPFTGISFETVPSRIIRVPSRYHHQTRGWYSPQRQWDNGPRYRNDRGWNNGRNDRDWNNNDRRSRNDRRWRNNGDDDRRWRNNDRDNDHRRGRDRGDDQD